MSAQPAAINLDGLQVRDRVVVYYGEAEDEYYHDRVLLAQVSKYEWVVATPHWDLYVEDVQEHDSIFKQGVRGGMGPEHANILRVKFDHWELQ